MQVNDVGQMVENVWSELPERFPNVVLDAAIVMPNHFHGILLITDNVGAPLAAPDFATPNLESPFAAPDLESSYENKGTASGAPTKYGNAGAASSAPTLGKIMRAFKSISAIEVNRLLERQGRPLWQRNYYERSIRNDDELSSIREYIMFNP